MIFKGPFQSRPFYEKILDVFTGRRKEKERDKYVHTKGIKLKTDCVAHQGRWTSNPVQKSCLMDRQ